MAPVSAASTMDAWAASGLGKLIVDMFASPAEYERSRLSARTRAGLAAAMQSNSGDQKSTIVLFMLIEQRNYCQMVLKLYS